MNAGWRRVARLAAGLGILGAMLVGVDAPEVGRRIGGVHPGVASVAIIGLTGMHLVPAAAWRQMLDVLAGARLSWRSAMAAYYAAQGVGGLTPANLGGDLHRVINMRSVGHGWWAAGAPIVVQRATSYLALTVLSAGSLAVLAGTARTALPVVLVALGFSLAVGAAAILLVSRPDRLGDLPLRLARILMSDTTQAPRKAPEADRRRLPAAALAGFGYGLVFHAGSVAFTGVVVLSVAPTAPLVPVLGALAVARLSLALPLTPSGLGVQEAAFVVLSAGFLQPHAALAALLLARGSLLLTTVIGAVLVASGRSSVRITAGEARAARG